MRLGISPVQALGHLHLLWHNVLELREDGDITEWTEKETAYYAGIDKNHHEFYLALQDGFVDNSNGLILLHDWLKYVGRYLRSKYRTADPQKIAQIESKHGVKPSPSKVSQKTPHLHNIQNQHTEPTYKTRFADFVHMTDEENKKLREKYGLPFTDACIEKLNNYKGASGKKYISDYRAILHWVVDEVKKSWKGSFPDPQIEAKKRADFEKEQSAWRDLLDTLGPKHPRFAQVEAEGIRKGYKRK